MPLQKIDAGMICIDMVIALNNPTMCINDFVVGNVRRLMKRIVTGSIGASAAPLIKTTDCAAPTRAPASSETTPSTLIQPPSIYCVACVREQPS